MNLKTLGLIAHPYDFLVSRISSNTELSRYPAHLSINDIWQDMYDDRASLSAVSHAHESTGLHLRGTSVFVTRSWDSIPAGKVFPCKYKELSSDPEHPRKSWVQKYIHNHIYVEGVTKTEHLELVSWLAFLHQ